MKKLFFIQFGKPSNTANNNSYTVNYLFNETKIDPVFVVAETYKEAISKALLHLNLADRPATIVNEFGDIKAIDNDMENIKSIEMISNNVIV